MLARRPGQAAGSIGRVRVRVWAGIPARALCTARSLRARPALGAQGQSVLRSASKRYPGRDNSPNPGGDGPGLP